MTWSTIVAGDPERWMAFDGTANRCLDAFRAFVHALVPDRDGLLLTGVTSVCGHHADIARAARRPAVFCDKPSPSSSAPTINAAQLSMASRRDRARAFLRVSGTQRDAQTNLRGGRVELLDCSGGACWMPWMSGERICLAGMRVELLETPRAGLHIRVGVPVDGLRNIRGYQTAPPRFVAAGRIAGDGVIAVVPCDPVDPVRPLLNGSTGDSEEDAMLRLALAAIYGASPVEAEEFLRGTGASLSAAVWRPARAA